MPFYNYGQNIDGSGLSQVVEGAEHGLTFAEGIKSMLQKRAIDKQKAADEHTTAGIDDRYKMKEGGFEPVNDPGLSNPTPQPGLFSRIGHALTHPFGIGDQQGGEQHTATGQNAGTHTTAPFVDTGKMLTERVSDANNAAAKERNDTSEAHADWRTNEQQVGENQRELEREGSDDWRTLMNEKGRAADRNSMRSEGNATRTMAVLQRYIAAKQARLNGMGGLFVTDAEKAQLQKDIGAATDEMARVGGLNPKSLHGGYDDPDAVPQNGMPGAMAPQVPGHVDPNDPLQGYPPSIFGGKHPPATDKNYMAWLKANVPLPQR